MYYFCYFKILNKYTTRFKRNRRGLRALLKKLKKKKPTYVSIYTYYILYCIIYYNTIGLQCNIIRIYIYKPQHNAYVSAFLLLRLHIIYYNSTVCHDDDDCNGERLAYKYCYYYKLYPYYCLQYNLLFYSEHANEFIII